MSMHVLKYACIKLYIDLLFLIIICDRLWENRAQRGVRKYREKIDRFLKNVLF